jgi:hypothetical protein
VSTGPSAFKIPSRPLAFSKVSSRGKTKPGACREPFERRLRYLALRRNHSSGQHKSERTAPSLHQFLIQRNDRESVFH